MNNTAKLNSNGVSRRRMLKQSGAALAALGVAGAAGLGTPAIAQADDQQLPAQEQYDASTPRIVLVHGAWADGTGWQHIIPRLELAGYPVIAVQNSLTSLADDVATTKRVIDAEAQKGPVVVVGHSYGGAVITNAADGNANVKALVYLAAFAPDADEPLAAFLTQYPSLLITGLMPDAAGFIYIDRTKFRTIFAQDVDRTEVRVMAAAQKPVAGQIFGETSPAAAWRTIPSWYLVSKQDNTINPDLQRFYASRMGATTSEIQSSHVAFISHPREVARLIDSVTRTVS